MGMQILRPTLLLSLLLALLLSTTYVGADGGETGEAQPDTSAEFVDADLQAIFAPPLRAEASALAPSPFTLLTPIRQMLSSRLWLMASGLDARPPTFRGSGTTGVRPGFSFGNLAEVFVAPGVPQTSAPAAPSGQALVPFRDPAPAFSRDILISRDFSNAPLQTEPHIAVNPNDPEHLLMGTIDYNFPNVSAYVSIDGGATWNGPNQPQFLRDDLGSGGDPIMGFDRQGNAYFAFISIGTEEYTVGPAVDVAVVSSIAVARSSDGGFTWAEPVSSARSGFSRDLFLDPAGRTRGTVTLSFLDKPWMAIGPNPDDPSKDVIYVTYTEFAEQFGLFSIGELPFFGVPVVDTTIWLVASEDGGRSWSDPVAVSPTVRHIIGDAPGPGSEDGAEASALQEEETQEPTAVGTKRTVQGSQPAVGPNGVVYVSWLDTTNDEAFEGLAEVYIARSTDGGKSFSASVKAGVFNEPGFAPRNSFFRYWGSAFPQIATGPGQEVYLVYTGLPSDKKNDDGDIYMLRSLDGGQTWSRATRLNDDATSRLQFFPSVTVDPNGTLHAMWGDMRDDRASTRYHIYYTRSEDKGQTFGFVDEELDFRTRNARVTDFPSNPNKGFPGGVFIGDYFSMTATEEDVYMVWADTRLGEFGPINQKIGFSRRTAIRAPEVFLSPPAGSGGQPVTLQGFNFQPETNAFIQVGGVVVSTERTDDQGRFTTRLFIPISGKGAHDVVVLDESGNVAAASFFMEFGFDTVRETQSDLADRLQAVEGTLGTLQTQVSETLTTELAKLGQTLPAVPAPPPAPAEEGRDGVALWLFITGIVVAALVGIGAALGASQLLSTRKQGQQRRWDSLR